MRIAIKAAQIAQGGGLTHLNKIIEWFGKLAPENKFYLLAKRGQEKIFIPAPENFEYIYSRLPGLNLPAQLFWERQILPAMLKNLSADLLFEPGNRGTLASPCPKVTMIHNVAPFDSEYCENERPYQKLRLSFLRKATFESMKCSQGIIYVSKFARNVFSKDPDLSHIKFRVIYHGKTDINNIKCDKEPLARLGISDPYLLSVSDIWRYKKIFEMVQSYLAAISKEPSLPNLVVVGANHSPDYFREIQKLVERSGQKEKIIFTGPIPSNLVQACFSGCQAFLFPSVLEACPNILIEALASECAIVTSNRGVMPEIADDAAIYVNPDNIDDFSSKIISISKDKDLNSSLRHKAGRRAQSFSWEKTAGETLGFLYDVAEHGRYDKAHKSTLVSVER